MNILEQINKIQSDVIQGKNINVEDISNIRMKLEEISQKVSTTNRIDGLKLEPIWILEKLGELDG
jgi:hypothetical protein|tara:strand:- start:1095 stop:1289 length:195 start_codon:yes stop_codon:yes gene_type:complete